MPCYEYVCHNCDYEYEEIKATYRDRETTTCPRCRQQGHTEVKVSVPAMFPDSYWAGHMDDTFGYVTSKSELKRKEAQAGLRRKEPGDSIHAKMARKYREGKEDRIRREAIGETVKQVCNT
jgi:putative FmdB family regulatory protein